MEGKIMKDYLSQQDIIDEFNYSRGYVGKQVQLIRDQIGKRYPVAGARIGKGKVRTYSNGGDT